MSAKYCNSFPSFGNMFPTNQRQMVPGRVPYSDCHQQIQIYRQSQYQHATAVVSHVDLQGNHCSVELDICNNHEMQSPIGSRIFATVR
ncbi:hypothetical protein IG631_09841 [Alternaria alternata]|nr:hypothetical protein IG631_09841 [Alternaria alternata]